MNHHIRLLTILILLSLLFSACIHHREMVNFNEGPEFSAAEAIANQNPILLQSDDLLNITVQSVDPIASAPFNFVMPPDAAKLDNGAMTTSSANNMPLPNYLIDHTGNINFPTLGQVKAAGLSTQQLRDTLALKISKYVQNPIINVRLTNFRFTIMGEVTRAGTFSIANERINILQALGMAGDLTNYGNRENVLIVRERDGQRQFGHLNLHQRDLFQSPYFYLQQNDLVYIEPLPAKVGATADGATKYVQWAFPIISIISVIVSLTR